MRLYFVRHGESEANLLQEFSNRGLKHGLTPTGVRQATALAEALRGLQVAKIYLLQPAATCAANGGHFGNHLACSMGRCRCAV